MKFLIIDSNFICHQGRYSLPDLSIGEQQTAIIFGFLKRVVSLAKKFETGNFIFCWDSKKSFRKEIYPEYKANRKKEKTEEEKQLDKIAFSQFDILKNEVLPELGFKNIFEQKGYESDDLIADIVLGYEEDFVVVSSDEDLFQLLDICSMYNPTKDLLMDKKWFVNEYEINPIDWVKVKQIAGCRSDNIQGVKGVAEKTFIKYLKGELKSTSKKYQDIVSFIGSKEEERNKLLVTLPFPKTMNVELVNDLPLKVEDFISVCTKFDFKSFIDGSGIDTFRKYFCEE